MRKSRRLLSVVGLVGLPILCGMLLSGCGSSESGEVPVARQNSRESMKESMDFMAQQHANSKKGAAGKARRGSGYTVPTR
ncbi:hypothetical protein [Paludisphaera borealis]|uniref:Uncharacterized protein n=1 Tax=Paludisphaera borealis TaxID=1387353 RepID=A0A1U7CIX7_9BACT|nr:hypothetical protein [Paludisphaera borealis]APW58856.1 hypothetical protein BSF38_00263 [Paludisphaera borealis]